MNWQAVSFDWNQARAFLATAEEGSLSAAARALGLTQPTLGRQVAALEQELGIALFERVGRSLSLTHSGLDLLDHFRAMGDAAARISLAASGRSEAIEGQVSITASDAVSAFRLPRVLAKLRDIAPGIEVEVIVSNEVRDLRRREADIAIRHVRPEQPELIARLVGETPARFYAAGAYLARRGRPASVEDLPRHDFIGFAPVERMIAHLAGIGIRLARRNFPLVTDNGIVAFEMTRQGLGIAIMPDEYAAALPGVECALPELAPIPVPVWLATHRELHTSRRIRLVFDLLAEELGSG